MGERAFTSDFAILDVKKGRKALAKHFENRPRLGKCPKEMRIPVVIRGYIECVHGSDDGTSQEFAVTVKKLEMSPTPTGEAPDV